MVKKIKHKDGKKTHLDWYPWGLPVMEWVQGQF